MPDDNLTTESPAAEVPVEMPVVPNEPIPPVKIPPVTPSEPVPASAPPTTEVPVEVSPSASAVAPTVVTSPTPPPAQAEPAPAIGLAPAVNLKSLLAKAMETIRFRRNAKLEKIMKFVGEKGSVTNDQAQMLLRISDATASRYLLTLTQQGRLRRTGKTSGSRYESTVGSNGGN
ncbi:MAG: hypothetical protein WC659_02810 [Patescibacteria group bacterium]